jgi:hypothetical protein
MAEMPKARYVRVTCTPAPMSAGWG